MVKHYLAQWHFNLTEKSQKLKNQEKIVKTQWLLWFDGKNHQNWKSKKSRENEIGNLPLERVRVSGPMSCSAMIAKSEILKKSKNVKNWSQYTQIDQCFSTMSLFTSKPHLTTQLFSQKQTNSSGLVNWQQKNIDLKRATPKQKNEKKSVKSAY